MPRLPLPASTAAAVLVVLAGCGAPVDGEAGGGPSPPAATMPSSPISSSGTSASPVPPGSPPESEPAGTPVGPVLVLDGVATRGVEPGCVVLSAGGRQYLLVASSGAVPLDVPIRVRGQVLAGVLSYCQQGTPFKVVHAGRR